MANLKSVLSKFMIQGTVENIEPLKAGLINDSYKVFTAESEYPDYVLQRINNSVFKDIALLEINIYTQTPQIKNKLRKAIVNDIDQKVFRFLKTLLGGKQLNKDVIN